MMVRCLTVCRCITCPGVHAKIGGRPPRPSSLPPGNCPRTLNNLNRNGQWCLTRLFYSAGHRDNCVSTSATIPVRSSWCRQQNLTRNLLEVLSYPPSSIYPRRVSGRPTPLPLLSLSSKRSRIGNTPRNLKWVIDCYNLQGWI